MLSSTCSVTSDALRPHGLQHARLPCPSPTPRVYPKSCPSSQWCHPTILASVTPFSSRLQSFQHQGLFQWMSSSHQVVRVLELQLQHQSFQRIFRKIPWRRERLRTPVFWPGEFHGLYSPWVTKSQTRLSDFHFHFWLHHHIPTRMTKFKTVTISTELNRV